MKHILRICALIFGLSLLPLTLKAQIHLKLPEGESWLEVKEGETLKIALAATGSDTVPYTFSASRLPKGMVLRANGQGTWTPDYDVVTEGEQILVPVTFRVVNQKAESDSARVEFLVKNTNRPPDVSTTPIQVWVEENDRDGSLRLRADEIATDPDGGKVIFKLIKSDNIRELSLTEDGLFKFKLTSAEYKLLPQTVEFEVIEVPTNLKATQRGQIRLVKSTRDRPPVVRLSPPQQSYEIGEGEAPMEITFRVTDANKNLEKFELYTDPAGRFNPKPYLFKVGPEEYIFRWAPDYNFTDEQKSPVKMKLIYQATDSTNLKTRDTLSISILNQIDYKEIDSMRSMTYKNYMLRSTELVSSMEERTKELNKELEKLRKGKKNRYIVNAGVGGLTALSGILTQKTFQKVATGVGGAVTLGMSTLETTIWNPAEITKWRDELAKAKEQLSNDTEKFARFNSVQLRRSDAFVKEAEDFRKVLNNINNNTTLAIPAATRLMNEDDVKRKFDDYRKIQ